MLRSFLRTFWKTIVALAVLVAVATVTMGHQAKGDELASVLRKHVYAIATNEHNTAKPVELEYAARYIETELQDMGYQPRRQPYTYAGHSVRNIVASLANPAPGDGVRQVLVVGAHYDSAPGAPGADDNGSGVAALIEIARQLRGLRPATGTELQFVFYPNEEAPYFGGEGMGSLRHARALNAAGLQVKAALVLETIGYYTRDPGSQRYPAGLAQHYPSTGNFLAFVGTTASAGLVKRALAGFRAVSSFPAEGLAAPPTTTGVTLSDHASYERFGFPALMITDTAFMRYPYYHTVADTPDKLDYASLAQVVGGLSKMIAAMASEGAT